MSGVRYKNLANGEKLNHMETIFQTEVILSQEVWKEFVFENKIYKISNFGRVCNINGKLIKQRLNQDGYPMVTLGAKAFRRSMRVHVLVAQNFVKNSYPVDQKVEVNHIDFNRKNNYYLNLEWLTHKENVEKSIAAGRMAYQNNDFHGKNNPNYGNKKLSKIYSDNLLLAKEKQGRPGIRNGRCVPIRMIGNGLDIEFLYIKSCVEYLYENNFTKSKKIDSNISTALAKNKKYLGFNFYRI
jgi:hypothetical protein